MHTLKAGPILVAISPFKKVPMYGNNYIEAYKRKITKSPHVYAITNTTIREMIRDEVNQSIIIREANTTSVPVARPIWMEFPSDEATFSSDEAFMRAKHASVYLPEKQSWYDLRTEAGDTIGILSIGLTYEIIRHHSDKVNQAINRYTVKSILWQLLNGLHYLHRENQLP